MNRFPALGLLFTLACNFDPIAQAKIEAARQLERKYPLRASAAGEDCLVLVIRTDRALDDRTVESIQYGTGEFSAYPGGLQQFMADQRFRAVLYRDAQDDLWTYGSITRDEAQSIASCR